MLAIEYDVDADGRIELVALVNAVEEDGADDDGRAWMAWRGTFEDRGMGCARVPPDDVLLLEDTEDPELLRAIVERIVLADRAHKESVPPAGGSGAAE